MLRCIGRTVDRIFEMGDKEILASYQKNWAFEPPAPNELPVLWLFTYGLAPVLKLHSLPPRPVLPNVIHIMQNDGRHFYVYHHFSTSAQKHTRQIISF